MIGDQIVLEPRLASHNKVSASYNCIDPYASISLNERPGVFLKLRKRTSLHTKQYMALLDTFKGRNSSCLERKAHFDMNRTFKKQEFSVSCKRSAASTGVKELFSKVDDYIKYVKRSKTIT